VTISVGDRYQTTAQSDVLNPGNALGSPSTLALDLHEENGGPTLARTVRVAANTSFVHLAELQAFGEATAITTAPGARLLMAGADMSLMTEGPVTLQNATARGSQTSPSLLVGQTIDGTTGSGGWGNGVDWGSGVEFKNNVAVWETASDIEDGSSSILEFIMNFSSYGDHGLGKFRLLATNADRDSFADGLANGGDVGDGVHWIVLDDLIAFSADSGLELVGDDLQADGWFLIDDTANPGSDEYGILLGNTLDGITGFRLEIADDPSLTGGGPGLSNSNGNSVLTELSVNFATIASTPEPGTVWLFALLVPAALLVRRRRLRCQS